MALRRSRVLEVLLLPLLLTRKRRLLVAALAGILALVMVSGGVVVWLLTHGPTSLDFLAPRLERAVSARLAPLSIRLGGLVLEQFEWGAPVELRLAGLEVLAASGERLAALEGAKLVFAPGVLRGELALLAIEIDGLELGVTRTESGTLELDVGAAADPAARERTEATGTAELVEQWLDPDATEGIARLERVLLHDATLRVGDRQLGASWRAEGVDLELRRGRARITGKLDLELLLDRDSQALAAASAPAAGTALSASSSSPSPIAVRLEGGYDLATRRLDVAGDVDRLVPARLLGELGDPLLAACLEPPMRGTFEAATDESRRASAAFSLHSTAIDLAGSLAPPVGGVTTVHLDLQRLELGNCAELSEFPVAAALPAPLLVSADLDVAGGAVRGVRFALQGVPGTPRRGRIDGAIDLAAPAAIGAELELHDLELWRLAPIRAELAPLDDLRVAVSGQVTLRVLEHRLAALALDLTTAPGELRLPFTAEPVAIGASSLQAEARDGLAEIDVSTAHLALGDRALDLSLELRRRGDGYEGRVDGVVTGGSIDGLLALWPRELGSGARTWIEKSLEGTLGEARVALTGGAGGDAERGLRLDSIEASVPFTAVSLRGLLSATTIEELAGMAHFSRDRIDIEIAGGRAGEVRLDHAQVTLHGLGGETSRVEADAGFAAPLDAALAIAAAEPIGVDVAPLSGLDGSIAGRLWLDLPLADRDARREQVGFRLRSSLQDLAWADGPIPLEGGGRGDLEIDLASRKLDARGNLAAEGIEADFAGARSGAGSPLTARLRARLDARRIASIAPGVERYLAGETSIEGEYTALDDGAATLRASADLERSTLDLPPLAWRKEAGVPGKASVAARRGSDGVWTFDEVSLHAGDLEANGAGRFTVEPFRIEQARLDRLVFPGGDLRAEAVSTADGGYRVEIAGDRLDAGPMLSARGSGGDAGKAGGGPAPQTASAPERGPIAIEVALAKLAFGGAGTLLDVQAHALLEGGTVRSVTGSGRLDPAGLLIVELGPAVDGGVGLRIETDELGAVLETLQGSHQIAGGQASIEAHGASLQGPLDGAFAASDLRIVEEPILYKILTLASLQGLLTVFGESGIVVRSIDSALHFEEDRLEIRKLRLEGPSMLLGLNGTVDLAASTLDVEGLVTRTGPVKRLLGKVPILKWLLKLYPGSLVAARFEVEGPLDDPEVRVFPVADVTPELLDDMVHLLAPGANDERDSAETGQGDRQRKRKTKGDPTR